MDSSQTAAEAVNPLTAELVTVSVVKKDSPSGSVEVQGRMVAPGLAITPDQNTSSDKPPRFRLTHVPSGLSAGKAWCGKHVQEIADAAVSSGVDWTAGQVDVVAAIKTVDGLPKRLSYWCDDWCDGDGPKPPIWLVRCNTCYWELDDSDGEAALTAADAKYAADDHRCEPEIEIRHPETGKWYDEWLVNKDGSVRDVVVKSARLWTVPESDQCSESEAAARVVELNS